MDVQVVRLVLLNDKWNYTLNELKNIIKSV